MPKTVGSVLVLHGVEAGEFGGKLPPCPHPTRSNPGLNLFMSLYSPSGVVYMYCLTQIVIWGFFYICVLFWATVHPFHFRNFKATGRLTYVHVISTILGFLLPCVPAFITLGTGYELTSIPPIVCGPANGDVAAYALLLPVSILAACSVSMLVVIFWIIMKVCYVLLAFRIQLLLLGTLMFLLIVHTKLPILAIRVIIAKISACNYECYYT